jgi:ribosomal protein S18 acetylase RimI-like enzyme
MVTFQRLQPADAALLSRVGGITVTESHGHSASPDVFQSYVDRSFSIEACRAELENPGNIFYGVYSGDMPAGYFKIITGTAHKDVQLQPITKLERLYLLKEYYGRRLGDQMLQQAIIISTGAGDKGMWLNVWKKNDRALAFYKKKGFVIVGEYDFVLTSTHINPNWVMFLPY